VSQVIQQGRALDCFGPGVGVGEAQASSGSCPARARGAAGQGGVDEPRRSAHPEPGEPRDGLGADQFAHQGIHAAQSIRQGLQALVKDLGRRARP